MQASGIDAVAFERARNQLTVRALRGQDQPARRLETAAQEVFSFGQPRPPAQWLERLHAVTAADVRKAFARMLASPVAVAMAGRVPQRASEKVQELMASGALGGAA